MIKYEVVRFDIETDKGRYKEVRSAFMGNEYDREEVASFNNLADARRCLARVKTSVQPMSGYYLHECKCIEVNKYDDNGEYSYMDHEEDIYLPCVEDIKYYTAYNDCLYNNIINEYDSYEDAKNALDEMEKEDKEDGFYKPNAYKIVTFKGGIYE